MMIVRVRPPNHNWRWGFYRFWWDGKCVAVGFRFPFSTLDLRLWFFKPAKSYLGIDPTYARPMVDIISKRLMKVARMGKPEAE